MRQDELAERLEAFAAATLDPVPDRMSEIRAVVVARAERGASPEPARHAFIAALGQFRFSAPRLEVVRRVGYVAGSAVLVLSMATGAMAASGPGGPLYGARIWFETMGLPSSGSARANSELPLLDQRLQEARDAARRGDVSALNAALNAYTSTLQDAADNAGPDDQSKIDATVSKHVDVLEGLLGNTGGNSQQAIQNAIDNAIDRIDGVNPGNPSPGPAKTPRPHPTTHPTPRSNH